MSDTTETMILDTFIAANKITMKCEGRDRNPNMEDSWPANRWSCVLKHAGRQMTVPFSRGVALSGPPSLTEVLDCLASDAASVENARSFEDWCDELGYDTDSRKAKRIFNACQRQANKLREFLLDDNYQTLLWDMERL